MDELAYSLVCASAVRECAVRARSLGMAACLVCGAVRSRDLFSAAGCAVYVYIETCAPHFTRVCVRYGVWHTISIGVLVHPLDGLYRLDCSTTKRVPMPKRAIVKRSR